MRSLAVALALAAISCPARQARERADFQYSPFTEPAAIVTGDVVVVYVALAGRDQFFKIDRMRGTVWICSGNIGAPVFHDPEPCRGLDGTLNPAPLVDTPKFPQ